eukprot:Awhi_evm1s290
MKMPVRNILFGLVVFFTTIFNFIQALERTPRDVNGLAPEFNKNHALRYERSGDERVYTVLFYEGSEQEMITFFSEFHEFIRREYRNMRMAHLTIPNHLYEEVILDIRSNPAVDSITHEILIESDGWEKTKISASSFASRKFKGDGAGVLIFIIDSGIDDHPEFENRIDRSMSRGFGERHTDSYTDSYDCQGLSHGTKVAGLAAGRTTGIATGATLVSYAVMRCGFGGTSSTTIEEAMADIYSKMLFEYSDKKIVVNLSNGPSVHTQASPASLKIEEDISNAGGIVIRAGGNEGSDACAYGQTG